MPTKTFKNGMVLLYDESDSSVINDRTWWPKSRRKHWYVVALLNGKHTFLHRVLMRPKPNQLIDHKNGNGLDCRRENMRFATNSQNQANRRCVVNCHGFKGVAIGKKGKGTIFAQIGIAGKQTYLGSFPTLADAAMAYDRAAILHFGEFACTNRALGLLEGVSA
jgi:hypothetical protein